MNRFHEITAKGGVRRLDAWGQGHFGAGRGNRPHHGVDFVANPGDEIFSPIDGDIIRIARPYRDDPRYEGLLIKGKGGWAGVEVKVFYVLGEKSGPVKAGERIGRAQNLAPKYPGITNHVHLEVKDGGREVSPDDAFWQCL